MSATDRIRPESDTPDDRPAEQAASSPDTNAERAVLESELRSRVKQQEALAQLGERALVEPDIERLLNDAVSTVAMTLSVDFVKILELLPGDNELLLRAGFGWKTGSGRLGRRPRRRPTATRATRWIRAAPVVTDDFAGRDAV